MDFTVTIYRNRASDRVVVSTPQAEEEDPSNSSLIAITKKMGFERAVIFKEVFSGNKEQNIEVISVM